MKRILFAFLLTSICTLTACGDKVGTADELPEGLVAVEGRVCAAGLVCDDGLVCEVDGFVAVTFLS